MWLWHVNVAVKFLNFFITYFLGITSLLCVNLGFLMPFLASFVADSLTVQLATLSLILLAQTIQIFFFPERRRVEHIWQNNIAYFIYVTNYTGNIPVGVAFHNLVSFLPPFRTFFLLSLFRRMHTVVDLICLASPLLPTRTEALSLIYHWFLSI